MDFLIRLFARLMAVAVIATPFCLFCDVNVQKTETLPHVKFNFEKPAADFKQAVDKKIKQDQMRQEKKRSIQGPPKGLLAGIFKVIGIFIVSVFAAGFVFFAPLFLCAMLGIDFAVTANMAVWWFIGLELCAFVIFPAIAFCHFGQTISYDFFGYPDVQSQATFITNVN